jgi:hypothetical protein
MRRLDRRLTVGLVALLPCTASPLLAHDTWLIPLRFAVSPGATVGLELTSAMRFPAAESAVAADRLAVGTLPEESKAAETDWESLFTTLTVSVRPER